MRCRGALVALVAVVAVLAAGAGTARAGLEPSPLFDRLEAVAKQVDAAAAGVRAVPVGTRGSAARAAGDALLEAAKAYRDLLAQYRATKPYGTLEEARLIETVARSLLDARVDVGARAGERSAAAAADPDRIADGMRSFITAQVVARMGAEGLFEFLKQTKGDPKVALERLLANARTALTAEVRNEVERAVRSRLGAFGKLPVALGVPLRDQLASYARTFVSDLLSRAIFKLGPGGIVVELLGGRRLVNLVAQGIESLFRGTGRWRERTERTLRGFADHQQVLGALDPDCGDRKAADSAVRSALRAIGATRYLEGDLRAGLETKRRREAESLLGSLLAGRQALEAAILEARARCGIESPIKPADLAVEIAVTDRVIRELPALISALGPQTVTVPTRAVCPASFTMGGTAVSVTRFEKYSPTSSDFHQKCVYGADPAKPLDEWFVIWVDVVPPDVGEIVSGSCDGGRRDDVTSIPSFLYSHKRYLTVSGGTRRSGLHADIGDIQVLRQALAAAEGQGFGAACRAAPG